MAQDLTTPATTTDHTQSSALSGLIDTSLNTAQPKKPFLVIEGEDLTYGAFRDKVYRLANVLPGLAGGGTVATMTTAPGHVASVLVAALRAGVPYINLNPELSPQELRRALDAARIKHLIIDPSILDKAPLPEGVTHTVLTEPTRKRSGLLGRLVRSAPEAEASGGLEALIANAEATPPQQAPGEDQTGLLLMTSGTTSAPKVVQLSHKNIHAQLSAFQEVYGYDAEAKILNPLPMHFTDGLFHGPLHTLISGATLYRPRKFQFEELETLLLSIYRDRISHFIVVPTLLALINRLPASFDDAFQTPDFQYVRSSGDRLPEPLWKEFEERFKTRVVNTYGLSETVCEATYCGPSDTSYRRGTIGKPVECEVRIVDPDGHPVPEGEQGELQVRGDIVMRGYLDAPDITDAAFAGPWFRTGDLAVEDADGFLTVVGRSGNVIISGGINIQPQDIVDVLLTHPDVSEAVAFGMEDRVFGEVAVAAVTLRTEDAKDRLKDADLIAHCRGQLAAHKVPRRVQIRDSLPRNAAGKPLIAALKTETRAAEDVAGALPDDLEQDVIIMAAQVFQCDEADLSMASEPRTTIGWDSFAHVQLVLECEVRYGISISPREFLGISRLSDVVTMVEGKAGADR